MGKVKHSHRPVDYQHGLTEREQQVIDRVEAGQPLKAIASELGIGLPTIQTYASRYIIGAKDLNAFDNSTRAGDARYRAALAACGGSYR